MDQHALELEDLFQDRSVSSYTVTNSLNLEREVYTQRAFLQAPPTLPQMANRQRGAQLQRSHTVACAFPHHTREISHQVIDFTQGWFDAVTEQVTHTDLLIMVAAVYIYVKPRFVPKEKDPHILPQQLEASAALQLQRRPHTCQALRGDHTVQLVVHQEFNVLQQLGYSFPFSFTYEAVPRRHGAWQPGSCPPSSAAGSAK